MEKYTIDIDKVLDEFEETEALKVHAEENPHESVIDQRRTTNGLTLEAAFSLHPVNKNAHKPCLTSLETSSATEFDPSLQKDIQKLSEGIISNNSYDVHEHEKIIHSNVISENLNVNDVQCIDDAPSKYLKYDIFYKSHESASSIVKSVNQSQTIDNSSEAACRKYDLCDSSPDEILCVSVQEEDAIKTPVESQRNSTQSLSFENVLSKDFLCEDSIVAADILSQSKVFPLVVNDAVLDSKESKCKFESSSSEKSDKISSLNDLKDETGISDPDKIPFYQSDESRHQTNDKDMINEIGKAGISNSVESCYELPSHSSNDLESKAYPELVPCYVEKQVTNSKNIQPCEHYLNKIVKCDDNVCAVDDLQAQIIGYHEIDRLNEGLENGFDIASRDLADVPINEINLGNNFSIQDDDSGVSSTEDISGNSPTEISNNESAKSATNENCALEDRFSCLEPTSNDLAFKSEVCDQSKTFGSSVVYSLSLQTEGNQNEIYSSDEKVASDIQSTEDSCVNAFNDFAGARPKLDLSNTDISKHVDTEVIDKAIEVKENISVSKFDLEIDESVLSKEPDSQQIECNIVSVNVPACENLSEEQHSLTVTDKNTPVKDSFTLNTNEDPVVDKNILVDDKKMNGADDSGLIEDLKDDFSPRLQRPTTLDLPSLQIATSETSTQNATLPEDNEEPLIDVSPEISLQQNIAEYIPCARQPQIGIVKPYWIPDAEAPNCMHCGMKFTVLKRRHHCRGCGKVLCSRCCNQKAYLPYLNKEDRICQPCSEILSTTLQNDQIPVPFDTQSSSSCGSSPNFSPTPQVPSNFCDKNSWRPHPNNPDDYCSTIPPLQQIQSSGQMPPPTVMVPIGVLKRGNKPRKEPKQVIFSDGIRPGGDLTDLTEPVETVPVYRRIGRKRVDKIVSGDLKHGSTLSPSTALHPRSKQKRTIVSDEEGPLPPVLLQIGNENDDKIEWNQVFERIQDDEQKAVSFALMKNMHLFVKLTKLDCCFGNECWCFTSCGLSTVGQDEVMVILERLPGEKNIPRDIFKLFSQIYDSASKGCTFDDLGHIIFPEQILDSSDHRGFLFVRPTFQCLSKLTVPNTPYLVAILIHKWEVPWAKVFPLRLMLRLGAECRYYPCALVSIRHRKPVYFEIGQTIMSVLADLRNYQFTIPVIPGLVVHMEEKKTCVNIPRNRYEKVMKVLNSNNVEHVLALGSNFSTEADSHLVCMQKEEGDYQTQAINIENTTRKVTGASFIVFSGALKSTSGLSAKFSIVEDGLLIQIPQETMVALHMSLRDMTDLSIECGQVNASEPEEIVIVQWTRDDKKFNIGVRSPIDSKSFEGIPNLRIHTSTDYAGENYLIRWTEVFFLDVDDNGSSIQNELVDPCRLAETVAQSCCMALTPYLDQLAEAELIKLGLRVTLDSQRDRVEYDIGARGKALPAVYMNALDSGLIPVLLRLSGSTQSEKLSFELIFHILIK